MLAQDDKESAIEAAIKMGRGIECRLGLEPERGYDLATELEARSYNTKERARAYTKANGHLGGEYFPSTRQSELLTSCSFDPEALEN